VDDGDFRADLREDAFPNSDRLARIDKSPQKEIGDIALAIFDLWKEWPVLLSLYWSESAQISPPERCSEGARWAVTRRQGQALRNAGEYKPAQERFETNLEIIEQRDEPSTQRKLAMCFSDLGVVKQSQGEYDDAEEYYQRSHSIFSEIGDQARSAKIAVQIGDSMMMRGETAPARGHFENSLTTARRIGALETEAMGLAGLGGLLSREGIETTEAKDYLHQAKRISKKTNSRPALSKSELGSADFHHKCDSFPEAIEHAQRACDIAGEIGNQILQRWSTQILALVYFDSKNYKTSGKEFEKAAKISMSAGATTETLVALSFAVEAFTENGDHERAMENCHQALNLFEREDADLSRINDLDRSFFEGHRDRLLRVSDWDFNDERRNSMDIESASSVVISV
jgi:tetratricopeptide (TPR) repeat protein